MTQPVNREIGIDDAHYYRYEEQQYGYLYGVIEEEIDRTSPMRFRR